MSDSRNNRKKRHDKKRKGHLITRNWAALAAALKSGSGHHGDRRLRRQRTRGAQKRVAMAEYG